MYISNHLHLLLVISPFSKVPILLVTLNKSSSSSSSIFHGIGPLVDPFRSHASRSLFNGLPRFLLLAGEYCFITLGNLLRGILFTCCIQFLLYSCSLSKIGVIFNSLAICVFVLWSVQVYPAVLLMYFISAAVILLASQNMPVQRLKVAILPLDLPCSGPVTHSGGNFNHWQV